MRAKKKEFDCRGRASKKKKRGLYKKSQGGKRRKKGPRPRRGAERLGKDEWGQETLLTSKDWEFQKNCKERAKKKSPAGGVSQAAKGKWTTKTIGSGPGG